jgi:hypothetical protein
LIGRAFAAKYLGSVAEYIASIGPIASLLCAAREVLLFLIRSAGVIETVPSIGAWPVIGGWSRLVAVVVWLPSAWIWLVVVLLWVAGAAVASLLGLIPYEVYRALWWRASGLSSTP